MDESSGLIECNVKMISYIHNTSIKHMHEHYLLNCKWMKIT